MKYGAVIFDLFGTLAPSYSPDAYTAALGEVCLIIGADPAKFVPAWTSPEAVRRCMCGMPETLAVHIRDVGLRIGLDVPRSAAGEAESVLIEMTRSMLAPRADAIAALEALKERGLGLALMSDCSNEVPELWPDTPLAHFFDVPLFSCCVGMVKPELGFYRLALDHLNVPPDRCLYVGDRCDELIGARETGMLPILICPPEEESVIMARESARAWQGPRIASLTELISYVDQD